MTDLARFVKAPADGASLVGQFAGFDSAAPGKVRWFTTHEVVARTLGWVVVTDPQFSGGADPTGTSDSYAAIQAAINYARQHGGTTVWLPVGTYLISQGLTATSSGGTTTSKIKIAGAGAPGSLFDPTGVCSVLIKRQNPAATFTMFTGIGFGLSMSAIGFDGQGSTGTLIDIEQGFELRLDDLRVANSTGYGMLLNGLSNAQIDRVHVDTCGSSTAAAVRIGKSAAYGISNTTTIRSMHIERSGGAALDIASGNTAADFAEFLQLIDLHIEQTIDGTALTSATTTPVLLIGNARGVHVVGGYIYGGKGPLVQVNRQQTFNSAGDPYSGVVLTATTLLGHTDSTSTPDRLVDLVAGNGFTMIGCDIGAAMVELVRVGVSFGDDVKIGFNNYLTTRTGTTQTTITDSRSATGRQGVQIGSTLLLQPRGDLPAWIGGGTSGGSLFFANGGGAGTGGTFSFRDNPTDNRDVFRIDTLNRRSFIGTASATPGTNPAGGFFLYVDPADGKLKCKGPSGTVTILGVP